MSRHTDTPWNLSTWIEQPNNKTKPMISAKGVTIAITHPAPICLEDECEANARHIVHCVNNHERLKHLVSSLVEFVEVNVGDTTLTRGAQNFLNDLEAEKGDES